MGKEHGCKWSRIWSTIRIHKSERDGEHHGDTSNGSTIGIPNEAPSPVRSEYLKCSVMGEQLRYLKRNMIGAQPGWEIRIPQWSTTGLRVKHWNLKVSTTA